MKALIAYAQKLFLILFTLFKKAIVIWIVLVALGFLILNLD